MYTYFKYISRNTPFSNATGHRGVACTKLKICTSKHRHRIVSATVQCLTVFRIRIRIRTRIQGSSVSGFRIQIQGLKKIPVPITFFLSSQNNFTFDFF